MDRCPVCGSILGAEAKACSVCGTSFSDAPTQCPLCNYHIQGDSKVCPSCGADIVKTQVEEFQEISAENIETVERPTKQDTGEAEKIAHSIFIDVELEELVKLPGIGPLRAKILFDSGYTDLRKLKQASVVELMNIRGIGRKAAGEIKAALREYSLEEIRGIELTEETIGAELQCPLCATIVSAYETSCYECGCNFNKDEGADTDADKLALSYYDSKLLRTPDNKDLWYARGATLVKMEEFEQAINSFNRAIEIDPSFQAAWMSKAGVYNRLGESSKAAECYSHIITSASGGQIPGSEDALTEENSDIEEEKLALEPPSGPAPMPKAEENVPEEEPKVPETADELNASTELSEIKMDYSKSEPAKPDYDTMTVEELKKELSQRATFVKPYLGLAKQVEVDINHAKRLISRAVTESKQGELKIAIQLMDEAINFAETEFVRKITEDLDNLAEIIRNLKSTGMDVLLPVEHLSNAKASLEARDIAKSFDALKKCLEAVEAIAG